MDASPNALDGPLAKTGHRKFVFAMLSLAKRVAAIPDITIEALADDLDRNFRVKSNYDWRPPVASGRHRNTVEIT